MGRDLLGRGGIHRALEVLSCEVECPNCLPGFPAPNCACWHVLSTANDPAAGCLSGQIATKIYWLVRRSWKKLELTLHSYPKTFK